MIEKGATDIVMVDLSVGGLTQWLKVAHLAEAFDMPVVSHLATEVCAHAVAAIPNGVYVEYSPWAIPLFKEVPALDDDGLLVLPEKPGLGLELDEAALVRLAVS
jgi:L-alanine-DL-glutamate epimerase-like enolase superfamily enzyme